MNLTELVLITKSKRRYLWGAFSLVCLYLVYLHTYEESYPVKLKVDSTTLGLLILAALPFLREMVETIKAGGVEVSFRELAIHQQLFTFLDAIAAQRTWTFYPPRPGESGLGEGLGILIEDLVKKHEASLKKQLKLWLASNNNNLQWFAVEIIGYFRIKEFEGDLLDFTNLDNNIAWEPLQLNRLWAYSRLNGYENLKEVFNKMSSETNQLWILDAYSQMVAEKNPNKEEQKRIDEDKKALKKHIEEFKEKGSFSEKVKDVVNKTLDKYKEALEE
jgi:hypothetical protein